MHVLSDMEATLKTMHMREIKVAVMALKKSGKSAVVNCLLGEEYTPASLETPTFTTCIYRRSKSKLISIRYGDRETFFDSPGEVKKYMMDLFKKMHRGEKGAFAAGDMEIDYVPSNDCLCNYTVIDTPGPDLAGTDHREIAYTWIREADVILFIIDYSKYLTSAEEEFLGEIKRVFEEYGKFYSLIVVVNKLDMMYMSDEKKSALRFTDFLRAKLKELGYRGFVVFGVSALQYLYSMQVTRISGCENLQTKDGKKFRENLNQSLVRYQGRDEMTTLSFLDTQIRNLRWFHGRKNATLRDLKETSGFKKLMKYINHVAMEKAHFEFFNHKMNVVEQKLADIRNNYLLPFIARCAAEGSDLDEKKNEIGRLSAEAAAAAGEIAFSEGDAGRIMRDLDLARKSLVMSLTMHIDTLVHQLEKILATLSGEKLNEFIKNGGFSPEDELSGTVDKKTIEKLYVPVLGKHAEEMNRKIAEKGNIFAGVVRAMQERVEGHSGFLRTDHRLGAPSVFSGLPASFCRVDFSPIILRLGPTCIQSLVRERLARKRGFVGWLLLIVTLGAVNTRTGRLKFNDIKLKKAILILKKELEQSAHAQVDALHEILFAHFTQHISVLKLEIAASIDSFTTDVETVCRHLTVDADVLQEEIAAKTALLKEMQNSLEQFSAVWDKIKNNEDLPAETQEE
jgi:GTPase Era involved in 16S rRNA processing